MSLSQTQSCKLEYPCSCSQLQMHLQLISKFPHSFHHCSRLTEFQAIIHYVQGTQEQATKKERKKGNPLRWWCCKACNFGTDILHQDLLLFLLLLLLLKLCRWDSCGSNPKGLCHNRWWIFGTYIHQDSMFSLWVFWFFTSSSSTSSSSSSSS
jgi:hypothetical protein